MKTTTSRAPRWEKIERHEVADGDLAEHIHRDLDGRIVTSVSADKRWIWLDILGTEHGPFDAEDYSFRRMVGVDA